MSNAAEAFALLRSLERGATQSSLPLPSQEVAAKTWRGLAFNVGAVRLVSALGEVLEVIALPALASIPGAVPWVLGVANLRGRLLPVVDLCGFLDLERTSAPSEWRVLVVEDGELFCGLLVEQSFGMLQFEVKDYDGGDGEPLGNRLDAWLRGGFRGGGRHWRVIDLRALVREPSFLEVAA
ncbi:MAG TPA: chemotaxis protein CheW [Pseudomonadales bacterium]|nr:chemotaxis protein CheW [Pseudomonadales bacterium]